MIHPTLGYWLPTMSPKQLSVFNSTSTNLLVSGPVLSGKTYGTMHKVVRHMWDTPGAKVAVVSKTVKSAKHGGSYGIMTDVIIPEWEQSGLVGNSQDIRFGYYDKDSTPRLAGDTRTNHFTLRNRFGGRSEFFLFSMDFDGDVSEKFKNTSFSCFWFIELTNFGVDATDYEIWRTTSNRLRMPHLTPEQHLWLGDTNPSEQGTENIWYRLFYDKHGFDPIEDDWTVRNLNVIEIMIEDNPWLSPTQISKIKSENRSDPALFSRNVLGRWEAAQTTGHFGDVFLYSTHIRGDVLKPNKEDREIIVPPESCAELISGWDPGDVNHSMHIICKRNLEGGDYAFDIIDELNVIGQKVSIKDFTEAAMERLQYWEDMLRELYGTKAVLWRHWSDSSIFDWNAGLGNSEDKLVYTHSMGKILLRAIHKPKGSVRDRVKTVRRYLFENRLFCSAQLTRTIAMFRSLKRGSTAAEYVSASGGHKHIFDSLTYGMAGEEPIELGNRMSFAKPRSSYIGVAA